MQFTVYAGGGAGIERLSRIFKAFFLSWEGPGPGADLENPIAVD